MYAERKQLPVENIKVELSHTRNYQQDCQDCEQEPSGMEAITRNITIVGELSELQRGRMLEIADKCPVHKTLHNNVGVISKLVD
jgi:putative redox protein